MLKSCLSDLLLRSCSRFGQLPKKITIADNWLHAGSRECSTLDSFVDFGAIHLLVYVVYFPAYLFMVALWNRPNFAALNRGCHLYSAGRPSRWALAHISSFFMFFYVTYLLPCLSFPFRSRPAPFSGRM